MNGAYFSGTLSLSPDRVRRSSKSLKSMPADSEFDTAYAKPPDCIHVIWVRISESGGTGGSNVPLVYQMMFAPGDWEHLRLDDNETIAQGEPLMFSCRAETIETAAENVNTESAKTLFYYGYSYCGRGLIDTTYVISRAKSIISFYWERFAAVILSLFILCVVLFVFRRRNMASGRRGRARRRGWLVCAMECAARMCPSLFRSRYYKKLTRDEDEKQEQGTPLVETPADATGAGTGVGGSEEQSSALRVVDDEEKTGSADF